MIKRDYYLEQLVQCKNNGMVKVITGLRRSGKSYLLFNIFKPYLLETGVKEDHILALSLDDLANQKYWKAEALYQYIMARVVDKEQYYVLLDEVQFVEGFEMVLNSFLHYENIDVYVTGSNAKFLSKDIITEFRGRGWQIPVYPLSFAEYYSNYSGSINKAYEEYTTYGGLPKLTEFTTEKMKVAYLNDIIKETYLKDIIQRNKIQNDDNLEDLLSYLSSSLASLTNPTNISNVLFQQKGEKISRTTIQSYLDALTDSFLIDKAIRYDLKGKQYLSTPSKYYFTDLGLRNARLQFRQRNDEPYLMENVLFNELKRQGYAVDIGVVEKYAKKNGKTVRSTYEVDFVCNLGSKRYYIQSAYSLRGEEKTKQEENSLLLINDNFKKIIITHDEILPHYDENGIYLLNIYDFLLNPDSLDK